MQLEHLPGVLWRTGFVAALWIGVLAIADDVISASAVMIALSTLSAVFLLPPIGRVPSHVYAPLAGACAMIVLSHLAPALTGVSAPGLAWADLAHELSSHLVVPALILSFAYLCLSLDHSGFFRWSALQTMRAAGGDGRRLLVCLFGAVSLLTFFTSNDIVILAVTPILIHLGVLARIQNLTPFLITLFVAANTASMGLYVGNPTNVIIGSAAGLEFVEYARRMVVPMLAAIATAFALVWGLFVVGSRHNRVPRHYELPGHVEGCEATPDMLLKVAAFAACLGALAVLSGVGSLRAIAGGQSTAVTMTLVSAGFAAALCVYDAQQGRRAKTPVVRKLLRRMPIEIVPFLLSFCIIVRGLEDAGLTRGAVVAVEDAFRFGPVVGSIATGLFGVLTVNLTNNIPASILFEKTWVGDAAGSPPLVGLQERLSALDPAYPDIFVDGSLYAANFGANLTFAGALAGLMWWRMIRDAGLGGQGGRALARDFMSYGTLMVPLVTLVTCLSIAWLHAGAP